MSTLPENQLMLPSGKIITFNGEQYEGLKKIKHWLKNNRDKNQKFFILAGYAGTGKQQPIDCQVQTLTGSKNIGDLKINDEIFGLNGELVNVNGVFPQGVKQAYKITFRDGTFTECGEEHLWEVWTHKLRAKKRPTITLTTKQILEFGLTYEYKNQKRIYKYTIPLCKPIKYEEKKLPLHPYILGVFIGDGTNLGKTPIISTPDIDKEIIDIINELIPDYIEIHEDRSSNCPRYNFNDIDACRINKLNEIFKNLGLNVKSSERFIPETYLHSSVEQRYELLRGLMDTDGTSRGNRIGFSTSSKRLMMDIIELVQSLGGVAIRNKDDARHDITNHIINIKTFENPFKIKRKSNNWKFSWKNPPSRHIISIEKSRIVEQVCISVDSKDGLYLTDNFIVTHNTTIIKKILENYRGGVVVSAPTHKAKKVIMNTTGKNGQTLHSLLGLRPDINLDEFNPNDPKFNPIAIPRITDYNFVIIDEASMINQELYDLILEKTEDSRTKVLFMGDPAQIPPVGERESVVFNQNMSTNLFHQLTKIERQNDTNPLAFVYDVLRNNLEILDGGFKRITNINELGEGVVFTVEKKMFRTTLLEKFKSDEYKKCTDFCKVIAWKNETVNASNKIIRNELFPDKTDIIEVGDVLMAYRSITDETQWHNIIENSADYRVVDKSSLEENNYGIKGFRVKLREDLPQNQFHFQDVFIIDANDHNNLHLYAQMHDFFRDEGKLNRNMWKKYYEFRRCNLLMKTIDKYVNGQQRDSYDIIVKDLDYGYAITGHKCLSENSNIHKIDGFLKIKDINVGDLVCVGNNNYEKVLDKIYVGKKRAFKLKTSFGYEIICSKEHRIMNKFGKLIPLTDFHIGEFIPINRNDVHIENIDITQRDWCYYLGLLVADGNYSGGRIKDKYRIDLTIGLEDRENIEFIEKFYNENDINFSIYKRKKSNCVCVYCENKQWREYLYDLGLNYVKGVNKIIPNKILVGTLQQKSNFIAGLFDGDGSARKHGIIRFVNNSLLLIKQVQNILLEFGIISYYRKSRKAYTLSILGTSMPIYKKFISFRLSRKSKLINEHKYTIKTNRDNVPFRNEILDIVKNDLKQKNVWMKKNYGLYTQALGKIFPSYSKNLSYGHLESIFKIYELNNKSINSFLLDIYKKHFFYDKIIEITELDDIDMYDLEIENIHQFIADGFIVHNSQGSTYSHVFVMENDINLNWVLKERNQIKYVALTRPSLTATVLTTKIDQL